MTRNQHSNAHGDRISAPAGRQMTDLARQPVPGLALLLCLLHLCSSAAGGRALRLHITGSLVSSR